MILRPIATTTDGQILLRIFLFYPIDKLKVRAIISNVFPDSHMWYKYLQVNEKSKCTQAERCICIHAFLVSMIIE